MSRSDCSPGFCYFINRLIHLQKIKPSIIFFSDSHTWKTTLSRNSQSQFHQYRWYQQVHATSVAVSASHIMLHEDLTIKQRNVNGILKCWWIIYEVSVEWKRKKRPQRWKIKFYFLFFFSLNKALPRLLNFDDYLW